MIEIFDTAIIGGGITGLFTAYELSKQGRKVVLFEKASSLGGVIRPVFINNYHIEGFYHHFFVNDDNLINLLNELLIPIRWKNTKTAFCYKKGLYDFSKPTDILTFNPLTIKERLKLAYLLSKILKIKDISKYDNIKAKDWLIKNIGNEVYTKFFGPLLWAKFNKHMDEVSAAWFIGRINMRSERSFKGEKLGYIEGGYIKLINALEKKLIADNNPILKQAEVDSIEKNERGFFEIYVNNKGNEQKYISRTLLSSIHPKALSKIITFPDEYVNKISGLNYQGTICVLFALKKPLTNFYWINIMEKDIHFGAIIEHTNFQPFFDYKEHVIYLASYPSLDSELWKMSSDDIFNIYFNQLQKLFPKKINKTDVNWFRVFSTKDSGLIYKTGIKSILPDFSSPVKGLFMSGMFNCYPRRPIEQILINSKKCVDLICNYFNNV